MQSAANRNFNEEKQRAADRMREMSARSKYRPQDPQKSAASVNQNEESQSLFSNLNIPFLGKIGADSDIALVLGLVLILSAEKSDKLLLLALLYILI